MKSLSIITPCSRPHHLLRMWDTIPEGSDWIVVFDGPNIDDAPPELKHHPRVSFHATTGVGIDGNAQRNLGLDQAHGEYVYFLDDDNVVHPAFASVAAAHTGDGKIVVVNQVHADGTPRLRARPPIRTGRIDTAQVLLPRECASRFRWRVDAKFADGAYFSDMYAAFGPAFIFLDVDAAYYNYLEPTHRRRGDGLRR